MPKANDRQVGGDHYKTGTVQHWDFAEHMKYLEGCATKYIARHADKAGLEDIAKACHFIEKIVERDYPYVMCRIILEERRDATPPDEPLAFEEDLADPQPIGYVDQDREVSVEDCRCGQMQMSGAEEWVCAVHGVTKNI